jgi:MraZ protein
VEKSGSPHKIKKQTPLNIKITKRKPKGKRMASIDYFERKLDDKHRLTIPTELRNEFASGVVLTRGFNQYLHLYPKQVWDREVESALGGSILDEKIADLNVKFRRGKTEAELDQKQGRVTIEQHLLDYAGIQKELVAVRAGAYWRILPSNSDV